MGPRVVARLARNRDAPLRVARAREFDAGLLAAAQVGRAAGECFELTSGNDCFRDGFAVEMCYKFGA